MISKVVNINRLIKQSIAILLSQNQYEGSKPSFQSQLLYLQTEKLTQIAINLFKEIFNENYVQENLILIMIIILFLYLIKASDPYKVLELTSRATDQQVHQAFKKLSKKWHPDINKSPQATNTYKQIINAYETIKNKQNIRQSDPYQDIWRSMHKPRREYRTYYAYSSNGQSWQQFVDQDGVKHRRTFKMNNPNDFWFNNRNQAINIDVFQVLNILFSSFFSLFLTLICFCWCCSILCNKIIYENQTR